MNLFAPFMIGLILVARPPARAEEPNYPAIKGPPPILVLARAAMKDGTVTLAVKYPLTVLKTVLETANVEEVRTVEGKEIKILIPKQFAKTVQVTEWHVRHVKLSNAGGSVTDASGKAVASAAVAMKLEKETAILLFSPGPVDSFYMQTTKPETLVLVAPAEPMQAAPQGIITPVKPPAGTTVPPKAPEANDEVKKLLDLTNSERKKAGLAELKLNPKLQKAAEQHSLNMAKQETLAHELDGKGPSDRIRDLEYSFQAMGENCAEGQRTPDEAVKSWLNSQGHRENLLNATYIEIGLGVAESKAGIRYWTQVFATPQK